MDTTEQFEVIVTRPRRVIVIHKATRCNAVPRGLSFTSKRRAHAYIRQASTLLVSGHLLRVTPETQAACAEIAAQLGAR